MSSSNQRYIPTKNFHIIPICGIAPDDLKQSAKRCFRDKEKVGHTTLLNLLAKHMGFNGGFSGYAEEFTCSIVPFMDKHGLREQCDLLTPRLLPDDGMSTFKLSIEQVSDRLFRSGKALPVKIFTGYNFNYKSRFEDAAWEFNQWSSSVFGLRPIIGNPTCTQLLQSALDTPPDWKPEGHNRTYHDLVLGGFLYNGLYPLFNLMGSFLVSPLDSNFIVNQIYWAHECDQGQILHAEEASTLIGKLFRKTIESSTAGWVDVIPYNENLIFLRGEKGEYDIILINARSTKFSHQIYSPFLSRSDVPSQMNEEYHFQRWYYFEYKGWREWDEHCAEKSYYDDGGNLNSYPGKWSVLRMYFVKIGLFKPWVSKKGKATKLPFQIHPIQLDSHSLYVSDLIPISELMRFSNKNPEYFEFREKLEAENRLDRLAPMNSDNPSLPAAVTWFDACAYLNYIEEVYKLPVRLLRISEYLEIRSQCGHKYSAANMMPRGSVTIDDTDGINRLAASPFLSDGLLEFYSEKMSLGPHPMYMSENKFQELECRYADILSFSRHPSGLKFVDSNSFCEWLYENPNGEAAACIRSKSLSSVYGTQNMENNLFVAWSSGKYKHAKVGFRLCYAMSK